MLIILSCFKQHFLLFLLFLLEGCAYRFTYLGTRPLQNIRTISIEGVYDTSKEIVPHEMVWGNIQKAIASAGQIMVTDIEEADAVLRVRIESVKYEQGDPTGIDVKKDPSLYEGTSDPPRPGDFLDLNLASKIFQYTNVIIVMDVEVWHLQAKKRIFKRSYQGRNRFRAVRADIPNALNFIRQEEHINEVLDQVTLEIAENLALDLLS